MKYLQFYIVAVILLVFLASCSTLPLFKKSTQKKRPSITPTAHAASNLSYIEKIFGPISRYLRKYTAECIAVAALLLVLLFYRLQQAKFQRRKHYKLDDDEDWLYLDWLSIPWEISGVAFMPKPKAR